MQKKRPQEATAELERRAWDLRTRCFSHDAIATELGVTQETVVRMLKRVCDRLAIAFEAQILQMRTEQTSQLMYIAREALSMWERASRDELSPNPLEGEGRVSKIPQTCGEVPSEPSDQSHSSDQSDSSTPPLLCSSTPPLLRSSSSTRHPASYLKVALKALADVRAIWGMEAAKKMEVNAEQPQVKAIIGITLEEMRAAHANAMQDRKTRRDRWNEASPESQISA